MLKTYYWPETFQNPNIAVVKLIITEYPIKVQTSDKSSKTIGKNEKVDSNSSLYSDKKESEKFLNEKNVKIAKGEHAFKGYASTYNIEILSSFNPELQLKDTESAITSKLIELLTQLKAFKFVTTSVLVFKELDFIHAQKQK